MFLSLALLFYYLCLRVTVADTCYFPDGSSVTDHVPCTSGNGTTMCCSTGEICLTSGLCKVSPWFTSDYYIRYPYYRGACTDASWQSNGCLKHCQGKSLQSSNLLVNRVLSSRAQGRKVADGGSDVGYNIHNVDSICGNDTDGYCCFEDSQDMRASSCVCSPGKAFTIRAGDVVTTISPTPSGPAASSETFKSASAASSSSISSSSSSPSSSTAPSNTFSVSTIAPTEAPRQSNGSVKLGVGIGVPVGIAALAAVGLVFWRRRRRYHRNLDGPYQLPEMPQGEPEVHEVGDTQSYESLHELSNDGQKVNEVGSIRGREGLHELPVDRNFENRAELHGHW